MPKTPNMSVNRKLTIWLVIVLIPFVFASLVSIEIIDHRLTERIETDLMNTRRLEAKRITEALSNAQHNVASLTKDRELVNQVANHHLGNDLSNLNARSSLQASSAVDVKESAPLQSIAITLAEKTRSIDSDIVELQIMNLSGELLGQTKGFSWAPSDSNKLIENAVNSRKPVFGRAFNSPSNEHRYGMVAPIYSAGDVVVGVLVVEARLEPVVGLVVEHEGFGDTSEAHLAQTTSDGDAEFITLLRFKRDAAFNKIVPKSKNLPINWSLESPGGRLVRSPDYRSIDSILAIETLPETGWGLVVKIDAEEAFQPVAEVRRVILYSATFLFVTIILGWVLLLRPLGSRLRKLANASALIAGGDFKTVIADESRDEIGETARSIDNLSTALINDMRLRAAAEEKLKYQANNDQLTGLFNRNRGHEIFTELDACNDSTKAKAVLFLDLNKFKFINDTYGHSVGDEILVAVSRKLQEVLSDNASIIRWGGDEFVVLLLDKEADNVDLIVEKLEIAFSQPFKLSRGEFTIGCSIGVSKPSTPDQSILSCVNVADSNMYDNKRLGRGKHDLNGDVDKFVADAIRDLRVSVLFQPVVNVDVDDPLMMRLVGVEALVRFVALDGEISKPGELLSHLRSEEVQMQLDISVMRQSLNAFNLLRNSRSEFEDLFLSLNIAGATLTSNYFDNTLSSELLDLELSAHQIVLEISEADEIQDFKSLKLLKEKGVQLALNNFGHDYSTIDRLQSMDVDVIKYNQKTLIEELVESDSTNKSAFSLLKDFLTQNYLFIATNIETHDQMNYLKQLDITNQQGYLFGDPYPCEEFYSHWESALTDVVTSITRNAA